MPYNTILTEKRQGLGIITLNRPDRMNAVNQEVLRELIQAFGLLEADREVLALCLTGTGSRHFSAGLELAGLSEMQPLGSQRLTRLGQSLVNRIENSSKPTIAAVNGLALGAGFELVLACDLAVAVPQAFFGFPEVRVGLIPAWGGTRRLAGLVGRRRVNEMVLTGELMAAERALQAGVLNALAPAGELLEKAQQWAAKMAQGGRVALWQARKLLAREDEMTQAGAQEYAAECLAACFSTPELGGLLKRYMERGAAGGQAEKPDAAEEAREERAEEEKQQEKKPSLDDFFE
jgi:enoyl-CoA hydratase